MYVNNPNAIIEYGLMDGGLQSGAIEELEMKEAIIFEEDLEIDNKEESGTSAVEPLILPPLEEGIKRPATSNQLISAQSPETGCLTKPNMATSLPNSEAELVQPSAELESGSQNGSSVLCMEVLGNNEPILLQVSRTENHEDWKSHRICKARVKPDSENEIEEKSSSESAFMFQRHDTEHKICPEPSFHGKPEWMLLAQENRTEKAVLSSDEWACLECTFINNPCTMECSMCLHRRPNLEMKLENQSIAQDLTAVSWDNAALQNLSLATNNEFVAVSGDVESTLEKKSKKFVFTQCRRKHNLYYMPSLENWEGTLLCNFCESTRGVGFGCDQCGFYLCFSCSGRGEGEIGAPAGGCIGNNYVKAENPFWDQLSATDFESTSNLPKNIKYPNPKRPEDWNSALSSVEFKRVAGQLSRRGENEWLEGVRKWSPGKPSVKRLILCAGTPDGKHPIKLNYPNCVKLIKFCNLFRDQIRSLHCGFVEPESTAVSYSKGTLKFNIGGNFAENLQNITRDYNFSTLSDLVLICVIEKLIVLHAAGKGIARFTRDAKNLQSFALVSTLGLTGYNGRGLLSKYMIVNRHITHWEIYTPAMAPEFFQVLPRQTNLLTFGFVCKNSSQLEDLFHHPSIRSLFVYLPPLRSKFGNTWAMENYFNHAGSTEETITHLCSLIEVSNICHIKCFRPKITPKMPTHYTSHKMSSEFMEKFCQDLELGARQNQKRLSAVYPLTVKLLKRLPFGTELKVILDYLGWSQGLENCLGSNWRPPNSLHCQGLINFKDACVGEFHGNCMELFYKKDFDQLLNEMHLKRESKGV